MAINYFGIVHTVQPGETLWLISRNYNVTLDQITSANPNIDPYSLQIGRQICIPTSGAAPSANARESLTYMYGGTSNYYLGLLPKTKNSIKQYVQTILKYLMWEIYCLHLRIN